ncbi:MAG: right-handed parallel beta-helix repeat-containing protein, partial [Deltaproteobacteria bacterium]|nr:right-handed parallel beta-helix repeat-containing protein [Deltaproteobacteria bacterium]
FRDGGAEFLSLLLDDTEALRASLARDGALPADPKKIIAELDSFRDQILKILPAIRRAYMETAPEASYSVNGKTLQVNLSGFAPVKHLEVEFDREPNGPGCSELGYISEGRLVEKEMAGRVTLSGRTLRLEQRLFSKRTVIPPATIRTSMIADAAVTPATYFLGLGCASKGARVVSVRAGYAGGVAEVARHESLPVYPMDGNVNIAVRPVDTKLRWSGAVRVTGVKEVDGDLEIEPGTTVRLAPGASVVIKGRLRAEGGPGKPIRFIPDEQGQEPWGAVVLKGERANGSVIRHAEFTGGSGLRHRHVEYSAMLSIHGVEGVEIDNCLFSDNKIVDDMVHAVYSDVTVKDSVFRGSRADALDLDYVEGRVINSRFIGSGNDALDLMSSRVAVLGSVMEDSGDKGISVGEGTDVFVWDTRISKNEIGVQAKDGSRAFLYNVELSENARTLDAYKKNWQYGDGGHVFVYKSSVRGPGLTADKSSSLSVYDSYMDTMPEKKKRIRIDGTSGAQKGFERRARTKESFLDSIELP